jgi:hypothetical protein
MSKDETKSTPNMEYRGLILGVLFYEMAIILWALIFSSLHFFGDAASLNGSSRDKVSPKPELHLDQL